MDGAEGEVDQVGEEIGVAGGVAVRARRRHPHARRRHPHASRRHPRARPCRSPAVERRVVGGDEVLRLAELPLRRLSLGGALRAGQVEVGHRLQEPLGGGRGERRPHHPVDVGPVGKLVLLVGGARLALGLVPGPLPEGEDPLLRLLDDLLAQLDRLGQHDLLLGRQQGDLADLLEVHADRVVNPDHVGRERLELLGGRLLGLLGLDLLDGRLDPDRFVGLLDRHLDAEVLDDHRRVLEDVELVLLDAETGVLVAAARALLEDRGDQAGVGGIVGHATPPTGRWRRLAASIRRSMSARVSR